MIARRYAYTLPSECDELRESCRRQHAGDLVSTRRWEDEFAGYVGTENAAVVNAGRRGLFLTLQHLGLKPGDEVIMPGYTFAGLIPPLEPLGVRIVPADVDPQTLAVTVDTVEKRITPRTRAINVLHPFGVPGPIEAIVDMARRRGLPVIEDCAHSLGTTVNGRHTGSFGYAGIFSFQANKPIGTYGGGMVVTGDTALKKLIDEDTAARSPDFRLLKNRLKAVKLERWMYRTNLAWPVLYMLASRSLRWFGRLFYSRSQPPFPIDVAYAPLQSKIGLKKLAGLEDRIGRRQQNAELYRSLLRPEIEVQQAAGEYRPCWYQFVVILPCDARRARKRMLRSGVDAGVRDEMSDHIGWLLDYDDCRNLNRIYGRLMTLPMHEYLTEADIRKVARVLNEALD